MAGWPGAAACHCPVPGQATRLTVTVTLTVSGQGTSRVHSSHCHGRARSRCFSTDSPQGPSLPTLIQNVIIPSATFHHIPSCTLQAITSNYIIANGIIQWQRVTTFSLDIPRCSCWISPDAPEEDDTYGSCIGLRCRPWQLCQQADDMIHTLLGGSDHEHDLG